MKSLLEIYNTKLLESFEFHDELNPKLWENNHLKKDISEKLKEVVKEFKEYIDVDFRVIDAYIVGSNASYNYSATSDLDIHIIVNFELMDAPEDMVASYFNFSKSAFNSAYNIQIKGIDVEVYVEDTNTSTASNGIYSLYKDEWIKVPKAIKTPDVKLEPELSDWKYKLAQVLTSSDIDELSTFIDDLYILRKNSILVDGEFGQWNLIFKEIRNDGLLDDLKSRLTELKSKELSLENINRCKEKKNMLGIIESKKILKESGRRYGYDDENKPETFDVCPYCYQEIISHGEPAKVYDHIYLSPSAFEEDESGFICEFCDEETDELYRLKK